MPRSIKGNRVHARTYRDLVWLAYLALPPTFGEDRRLVQAHRLAASALGRRTTDHIRLRQSILRRP